MKEKKRNKKKSSGVAWLLIAGVVALAGIGWYSLRSPVVIDEEVRRPVAGADILPPDMFSGRAREAYQAAKDIPQVLNKVPCYCGCMDSPGHASNLFCFTDRHGVG